MLLLFATRVFAFESQWLYGLHVATEHLTGQIGVNGVLFRVQRATGRDVDLLADRILDDWRRESGKHYVLPLTMAGWNSFSRIHDDESEVVQWRGTGAQSELLWSVTNLRQTGMGPPATGLLLPPDCHWLPLVHGIIQDGTFVQTTGTCPGHLPTVTTQFQRLFSANGWKLLEHRAGVLRAQRDNRRAQVVFAPTRDPSPATNVVILELGVDMTEAR